MLVSLSDWLWRNALIVTRWECDSYFWEKTAIIKYWLLHESLNYGLNAWIWGWWRPCFDCDSHLAKKLTMCMNDLSLAPSFELNECLIDWTLSLYNFISCYLVLGCKRASSTEKLGSRQICPKFGGAICQNKFVPNLGKTLGKGMKWSKQSSIHTQFCVLKKTVSINKSV